MEWEDQIEEGFSLIIRQIATAQYSTGPVFFLCLLAAAAFCCFAGYKAYRAILAVVAFGLVFVASAGIMHYFGISERFASWQLLLIETGLGLVAALLAYRIFLIGVFAAGYHLGAANIPGFFPELFRPVVSTLSAGLAGFLCVRATRMVIIILTAIIGGFTMINALVGLAEFIPAIKDSTAFTLPASDHAAWLLLKGLMSAAGVLVQMKAAPAKLK